MSVFAVVFAGLSFVSSGEIAFVALMLLPLLCFLVFALVLWRLLIQAALWRKRVVVQALPNASTEPSVGKVGHAAGKIAPADRVLGTSRSEETPSTDAKAAARFVLLVPAHNEALVLGAALDSLHALDYSRQAFRVVVIADNCTDQTAEIACQHGAVALERFDTTRIGKGYALEWALERLLADRADRAGSPLAEVEFDAVVVLDADTKVASNLLQAFAAGLSAGQRAMQARYDVLNTGESWRTRLMTCALALAHVVKPLGRERLGLSDGLKGNGMCFAREVVERVPWSGESITEDIEYTLRLCRAGYRIAFLPETTVWAQMPTTGEQATSQRKRWEGGRYRLLFTVAPGLVREALQKRSQLLMDRALEMIIPPFAEMFALPVVFLMLCLLAGWVSGWTWAWALAGGWIALLILQAGYLFGGMWVARIPATVAVSLLAAPFYIVWKFGVYGVMAVTRSAGGWQRTGRRQL